MEQEIAGSNPVIHPPKSIRGLLSGLQTSERGLFRCVSCLTKRAKAVPYRRETETGPLARRFDSATVSLPGGTSVPVAQWTAHLASNQGVVSSSLTGDFALNGLPLWGRAVVCYRQRGCVIAPLQFRSIISRSEPPPNDDLGGHRSRWRSTCCFVTLVCPSCSWYSCWRC